MARPERLQPPPFWIAATYIIVGAYIKVVTWCRWRTLNTSQLEIDLGALVNLWKWGGNPPINNGSSMIH